MNRVGKFSHDWLIALVLTLTGAPYLVARPRDCIDPELSKVEAGVKIMLCNGTLAEGTLTTKPCSVDAETNCIATSEYPSVDKSALTSEAIQDGVTLSGVTGSDKSQILAKCREGVRNDLYNASGLPGNGASNAANGSDKFDWWDVIDDYGGGGAFPSSMTGGLDAWGPSHYCNGSQIVEVTGSASWLQPAGKINCSLTTCTNAITFDRIFFDPYTGIYITNVLIGAPPTCTAGSGCANWSELVSGCENLNSGDGTSKWRLPTVKEWYLLYVSGIYGVNTSKFGGRLTSNFWTATNNSSNVLRAWRFKVFHELFRDLKTEEFSGLCVR